MKKFLFLVIVLISWIKNSSGSDSSYIDLLDRQNNKDSLSLGEGHPPSDRFKRQAVFQNPNKKYSECMTPTGHPGHCTHIMYCRMPELKNDVWRIVDQLCVIEKSSIGICCPDDYRSGANSISIPEIITNINDNRINGETRIVNRPEERGCGITTKQFPRIAGGRPAEPDEWPWMAAILRHNVPHIHCGGVLITDRTVLTAAHCVHNVLRDDIFVRLGEYDFELFNETRSRDFRVNSIIHHIDFDAQTYQNDIALLRVERPALFNTYIWPICIPPPGENWEGWNAIVTGWGTLFFSGPHSKVLMEVSVPVWKQNVCEKLFVERIDDTLLCAGAAEGGRDSCQGDSGGPLMAQLPNRRWVVIGLVSWGLRCGETNRPGLYTRIDKYLSWILENAN
ncbi:venom protease [Eupeodes corollae]|uniref:venom protease n=1 Tax=Eupeodes corollae TaxID=290404 RepID=UPI0024928B16|nr:venom protease [Eupeodes corollae]XP_055908012.1 venom protease [Eupeodes corollae]XP_055908013.1 venom protease [Eupeodes corollae]